MSRQIDVDYLGEDPIILAERLEALAEDIRFLAAGRFVDDMVADAPVLVGASVCARPRPALTGSVSRHPLLGNLAQCVTSELFALDRGRRWVRTMSRFYRLDDGDGR